MKTNEYNSHNIYDQTNTSYQLRQLKQQFYNFLQKYINVTYPFKITNVEPNNPIWRAYLRAFDDYITYLDTLKIDYKQKLMLLDMVNYLNFDNAPYKNRENPLFFSVHEKFTQFVYKILRTIPYEEVQYLPKNFVYMYYRLKTNSYKSKELCIDNKKFKLFREEGDKWYLDINEVISPIYLRIGHLTLKKIKINVIPMEYKFDRPQYMFYVTHILDKYKNIACQREDCSLPALIDIIFEKNVPYYLEWFEKLPRYFIRQNKGPVIRLYSYLFYTEHQKPEKIPFTPNYNIFKIKTSNIEFDVKGDWQNNVYYLYEPQNSVIVKIKNDLIPVPLYGLIIHNLPFTTITVLDAYVKYIQFKSSNVHFPNISSSNKEEI